VALAATDARQASVIIAYFGTAGSKWLEEQDSAYISGGFHRVAEGTY
jgi:hypothetical protein